MRATGAPPRQQSHSELRMLRASERRHKRAGPATREAAASATLGGRGGGVTVEATAVDCSPTCRRVTTPSCRSDQPPPLSDPPRAPAAPCQVCCRQRLEHVTRADCPSPHATAVAGCPRRVVVRACVAATDGERLRRRWRLCWRHVPQFLPQCAAGAMRLSGDLDGSYRRALAHVGGHFDDPVQPTRHRGSYSLHTKLT